MKKPDFKTSLTLLAAVVLTACGGNGSDSEGRLGSNESAITDPVGSDQTDGAVGNGDDNGAPGTVDPVCSGESQFAVTEFIPANAAENVSIATSIRVTFNTDLDEDSVDATSAFLSGGSAGSIDASLSVNGNALLINPVTGLEEDTLYTVNIGAGISAACSENIALGTDASSDFTTGGQEDEDTTSPEVLVSTPDLMGLLPVDITLVIDFSEPLDSSTVNFDSIYVIPVDSEGSPIPGSGKIEGEFSFDGSRVLFTPSEPLNGESFYLLEINTNIEDLSGNPLAVISTNIFRTESLTAVIEGILGGGSGDNPLADLQAALEDLAGNLLTIVENGTEEPGDEGGNEGGDGGVPTDPQALFELPLTLAALIAAGSEELLALTGLSEEDLGDLDNFADLLDPSILAQLQDLLTQFADDPQNFDLLEAFNSGDYDLVILEIFPLLVDGELTPERLTEFSSVLIAVCDPKGNATGTEAACTLSVNIGFGSFSEGVQQAFADALTNGDPAALAQSFLTIGELVFSEGGLVDIQVLDDSGLPLPEALEEPLVDLLDQIGQLPVLGSLTNQEDITRLVDVEVLKTSLATVEAGKLLSLTVISEDLLKAGALTDPNLDLGLLQVGGELIDALSDAGLEPLFDGLCSIRLLCTD
ncbi:Ig-like domain-containing protein [Thalassolituus maritimus]|uniref:Ig-like domain-containing protein n=1 Tax=Thalassolituus maritimus TaxID=484498 RepID=A0A1N7P3I1_9GAMM|nr:Ig-like domain-containing protein [Thalassolituus maritimus]SIT05151.1 Ig-like domain-containing protein [Thalassolituus maritimus]